MHHVSFYFSLSSLLLPSVLQLLSRNKTGLFGLDGFKVRMFGHMLVCRACVLWVFFFPQGSMSPFDTQHALWASLLPFTLLHTQTKWQTQASICTVTRINLHTGLIRAHLVNYSLATVARFIHFLFPVLLPVVVLLSISTWTRLWCELHKHYTSQSTKHFCLYSTEYKTLYCPLLFLLFTVQWSVPHLKPGKIVPETIQPSP